MNRAARQKGSPALSSAAPRTMKKDGGANEAAATTEHDDYVHFLRAKKLLEERFSATPHEIAMWVWFGKKVGDEPVGGLDGYRDPKRADGSPLPFHFSYGHDGDFDFLAPLMNCYFRRDDLDAFQPKQRWLTGVQIIERWARHCSEKEARDLFHKRAANGELESLHPLTGVTSDGLVGERKGFPALEAGMFDRAQVEAVEAECFAGAMPFKKTITARRSCEAWLVGLMSGDKTKTKAKYREEAMRRFPGLGVRAFDDAWAGAIPKSGNTAWARSGRPPRKS